jgi:hypothetical protein
VPRAPARGLLSLGLCLAVLAATACSREEAAPASSPPPTTPETRAAKPAEAVRVPDAPGTYEVRYYVLNESCPYCRDLRVLIEGPKPDPAAATAAPAEPPLAKLYEGKVRFDFRPAFPDGTKQNPEMKPFGFAESAHGFAGIAPDGTVKFTLPGHHQTRGELVTAIDGMLR